MEAIKFSIDVNIALTSETKEFISGVVTKLVEAKPVEAKPVEAKPVEANINIEDVRSLLAIKVNEHRSEIKTKLNELGAPSVTKLDPKHYEDMFNFLKSL